MNVAKRSRGTGPRATVQAATVPITVGRGPVPRHRSAQSNPRGGQHAAATPVVQDRLILTRL